MVKGKDLAEYNIVKEIAKGISPKVIANFFDRHVDTVKPYLANLSQWKTWLNVGVMKSVTDRDLLNFKGQMFKKPGLTSRNNSEQANVSDVSKSTRWR